MMKQLFTLLTILLTSLTLSAQSADVFKDLKFRNIGPAAMSGRVVDMAVQESDPYIIYVATATGGIWKTSNNGVTFKPVFEKETSHSVGAIALHQKHPKFVWVGTGERANRQSSSWGDGVYLSKDAGKTWTNMGLKDSHHIGRIALHPNDTNTVFVAALGHLWGPNEERGLYKTTDGGKNWKNVLSIDENTGVTDVAMDPSDPNIMYAATYQRRRRPFGFHGGGPGSGLYKSTDGGENWTLLTEGLPEGDKGRIGISIYRKDPNIVYVCVEQGFQYNASTAYNKRKAGIYRSEDKGKTWIFMSDWNPRPMYASQILVDPNNDQRIYMMNSFSYSDDGGKKFTRARQTLHGDDRLVWVNPKDSRHVIKGDDGGIGISYDKAKTWLYVTTLPVSQFYRVSVDMQKPYNVFGGLQDNGSWMGPSETYNREGIMNSDWRKVGGGDGFVNHIHPTDPTQLYTESQYLGLSRLDLTTGQRRSIRPGDPKGRIGARRNWDAWGPGVPEPELGNAMAPANWDGPFCFSHHDPNVIYAGTNKMWKSMDGGDSWQELGDLTTGVNRRELTIMGQRPDTSTASLDDGIPYYPTLTAIAESPFNMSLLYVGTDDGNVQVSSNGGKDWTEVSGKMKGLPKSTWVNGIETSKFDENTAYVSINNYRNNDFTNYLYKTKDGGKSWQSITGDLPADRVVRTLREDTKNPDLLYLGTELGLFITMNGGKNWVELKGNMPTLPFNDLVIHPRDNDLVLGTHGRGIWILDNIQALQEMTPEVVAKDAHLFSIPTAEMIRYNRFGGHRGNMFYRGENPEGGAGIDYYLQAAVSPKDVKLEVFNLEGELMKKLKVDTTAGLHRSYWDFRSNSFKGLKVDTSVVKSGRTRGLTSPMAMPGTYIARLTVGDQVMEQNFRITDDPRVDITIEERKAWTTSLHDIGMLSSKISAELDVVRPILWQIDKSKEMNEAVKAECKELERMYSEMYSRTRSLYGQVSNWMGPWTADQEAQFSYYTEMLNKLAPRQKEMIDVMIPKANKKLKKDARIEVRR
ncbi:MAG: hypothetical protein AAFO07_07235 [Bacteroidota bacterium]